MPAVPPPLPGEVVAPCPHCGQGLLLNATMHGQRLECPHCKGQFIVPGAVQAVSTPFAGTSRAAIQSQIKLPAIGMVVVAGIGVIVTIWLMVDDIVAIYTGQFDYESMSLILSIVRFPFLFAVALGGALMLNLRSYHFTVMSSILCLLPFFSPDVCFAIPLGIWSLVVLSDREVRQAFRDEAKSCPKTPEGVKRLGIVITLLACMAGAAVVTAILLREKEDTQFNGKQQENPWIKELNKRANQRLGR